MATEIRSHLLAVATMTVIYAALGVYAFPTYQARIPNGAKIPHPCLPGQIWPGVGHEDPNGGGPRNKFGVDFVKAGFMWTLDLCLKDSDGDGITNGMEIGDPGCKWTEGATPTYTESRKLTHPGVCEPVGSTSCKAMGSFLADCSSFSG